MSTQHYVRACLVTNPRSGKGGIDLSPVLPVLHAHGWDVTVRPKEHGGHATEIAREAAVEGYDIVVAAGGDGTVGEVVDGLAGTDVAVGVLPGGTANLWAHEIRVDMDLESAALQLVGAQRHRIDLGYLTIDGKRGQHFLLMAGMGMDAAVIERLNKRLKGKVGMLAYAPAIGRALGRQRPFHAEVEMDGVAWGGVVTQMIVGNTRRYAAVAEVTPEALVDDGRLDVVLLTPRNPVSAANQIASLVMRKKRAVRTSIADRVSHLRVKTDEPIPMQADGGRVKQKKSKRGATVYDFTVVSGAVTMLVPRGYDGALFPSENAREDDQAQSKSAYRVLAVGIDAITAARVKNGKVVTISIDRKTRVERDGKRLAHAEFLAGLDRGDLVRAKGRGKRKRTTMIAERIRF